MKSAKVIACHEERVLNDFAHFQDIRWYFDGLQGVIGVRGRFEL